MKKLILSSIACVAFISSSVAQTNTFPSNGDAAIGTTSPTHSLTFASSKGAAFYNTADLTTNFERIKFGFVNNVFTIGSEFGGTGTSSRGISLTGMNRNLIIGGAGTNFFNFSASTGTITGPSVAAINGTYNNASNFVSGFSFLPTINQGGGTGGYRGVWISPFESTLGSGNKYLIDAGTNTTTGGAGTHTSKFVVFNDGKTGVGTGLPSAMLNVVSGSNTSSLLGLHSTADFAGNNPGYRSRITVANTSVNANHASSSSVLFAGMNFAGTGLETKWEVGTDIDGSGGRDLYFFNSLTSSIPLKLHDNGNVGILSDAPMSSLQVEDGFEKVSIGSTSGAGLNHGIGYLGFNASRQENGGTWYVSGDGTNNGGGVLYNDIYGNINFAPITSLGTSDRTLTDGEVKGKVAFQIAANGTTRAKIIKVETANWPDYVFKADYKLKPLSDVKQYINKNRHLPDMPAAAEVEKNGQNLGEINKQLVKKVEELTLYLIKLDEKLQQQNEEIRKLKLKN